MLASGDIVSDYQISIFMVAYARVLSPALQGLAIVSNIVTMATFRALGLKDSMNVTFMALSVSDIAYVILDAINTACLLIALSPLQRHLPVSMYALTGCVISYQYIFLDASTCLETYMAIARCCCVAMPLKFNNVFTLARTLALIAVVFACNLVFRIPLLSSNGLSWQKNAATNLTRLMFYNTDDYVLFKRIEQIVARTVCPVIFLVIAVVCCVILTSALIEASKRRKEMTFFSNANHTNKLPSDIPKSAVAGEQAGVTSKTLKIKEIQLVKAVILITVLLGITLLFLSLFSLGQAAVPEFFPGKQYRNLHSVMINSVNLLIIARAGGKIIIYYHFNTRFRTIVLETITKVPKRLKPAQNETYFVFKYFNWKEKDSEQD
ncbi:hypothetical protein Btru_039636 [Bulinus truncatus]|nr:hypothetical protein Btru_039636 [Bulinus truncatus]